MELLQRIVYLAPEAYTLHWVRSGVHNFRLVVDFPEAQTIIGTHQRKQEFLKGLVRHVGEAHV
jgi:hypothetical protein